MATIAIDVPSSAEEGERVSASVRVTSTLSYHASYKGDIKAVPDRYPDYVLDTIDQVIMSGSSVTRNVSFTMPDCNVTVFIWVERWSSDHWVYDSSGSKVVSYVPATEPPTPTDEELIYANWLRTGGTGSIEYWRSIGSPLYYTPPEPEPEPTYHLNVHVPSWAAGGYIDPGSGDYPAYSTVKLTAYPLSGYRFTSWGGDASGTNPTYNLYMNSDKYVEAYFEKVPVEIYAGSIARKELEYDETRGDIPVY